MDKYLVGPDEIERQLKVAGKINTDSKPTSAVVEQLTRQIPFNTGWLPPGLRSYTQSGNHAQLVIITPPGVNRINWGRHEGDRDCKQYLLAQPWRIIIADTIEGNLFGTRMFYSPGPVNSPEQQLYHQNVPNINCRGYRGNGVGWVCLYHNESWESWSLAQKMDRIIERCSGSEAYNDANMDSTDGPRFYRDNRAPNYVCDPVAWEKKTEKEGVEWTFDSSLWIPVLVVDENQQDQHHEGGQPLTLEMAMNGKYNAYYGDTYHPKLGIEFRKGNVLSPPGLFREAYAKASDTADKKKAVQQTIPTETLVNPDPVPLPVPDEPEGDYCHSCGVLVPEDEGQPAEWGTSCGQCISDHELCDSCGVWYEQLFDIPGDKVCADCNPPFDCFACEGSFDGAQRHMINITPKNGIGIVENAQLCPECVDTHMICNGCGILRNAEEDIYTTKDMQLLCYACVVPCDDCNWLVPKDDEGHEAECNLTLLQQV